LPQWSGYITTVNGAYLFNAHKIANSEHQAINLVSKRTATNDLTESDEKYNLLINKDLNVRDFYELAFYSKIPPQSYSKG
jgi:hypothetical protein